MVLEKLAKIHFNTPYLNGNFKKRVLDNFKFFINPSTGKRLLFQDSEVKITEATIEDVEISVKNALEHTHPSSTARAFADCHKYDAKNCWATMNPNLRSCDRNALLSLAQQVEEHKMEMATIESLNGGKPFAEALFDANDCVETLRYFAGYAEKLHGRTCNLDPNFNTYTLRQPIGIAGIITSYNYPLVLATWKLAPALACGNPVIIKPHPLTPLSTLFLAYLAHQTGQFPNGVINVLPGGAEIGNEIVENKCIEKISFTGSGNIGKLVLQSSMKNTFKKVTLELGGKSPILVFGNKMDEETDKWLELVADDIHQAIFTNMGQNCSAGSRLYIQQPIYKILLDKIRTRAENVKIGDALDERFNFGPIVDKLQFNKIMEVINTSKSRQIPLLTGGTSLKRDGYFIKPTIFYDVHENDKLMHEEIFGPVLTIGKPFDTENEAIRLANKEAFGLASGIFTRDCSQALRLVSNTRGGSTWLNCYNVVHPGLPFGGPGLSGVGQDLGEEAIYQEYTMTKSVYARTK